jgi:RHS repeat-associated protein
LTAINDPRGDFTIFFDHRGRPTRQVVAFATEPSRFSSIEYDLARGQVKRWSNWYMSPSVEVFTELEHDNLGRLTRLTAPHGAEATVQYNGFSSVTNQDLNGNTSTQYLNPLRQIVAVEAPTDTFTLRSDYIYGPFGSLASVSDPGGQTTSLTYDALGRLDTILSPNTGLSSLDYNPFGELSQIIDAIGATTLKYDSLGRPTRIEGPDGVEQFVWRPGAQGIGLESASSSDGVQTAFLYDNFGRPKTVTTTLPDGDAYATTLTYDGASRVTRVDYPSAGAHPFALTIEYGGILSKRITDAIDGTQYWQALHYDPVLRPDSSLMGNGLFETRTYEQDSQFLRGIKVLKGFVGSTTVFEESTGVLFPNGAPDTILRSDTGTIRDFGYDPSNRLTSEVVAGGGQGAQEYDYSYYFDGSFLRLDHLIDGVSDSLQYWEKNGQQVSAHHDTPAGQATVTTTYDYDGRGRRKRSGDLNIDYNMFDLPTQVRTPTETIDFQYDAFGSRVAQTSNNTARIVSIGELYREHAANGVPFKHEYRVRLGLNEIAQVTVLANGTRSVQYLHRDLEDNVVLKTDEDGTVVSTREFGPFGEVRSGDPTGQPGFSGHMHETYAPLINMHGRIYDPQTRNFLSSDPIIAFPYGINAWHGYSYGLNSPFVYRDPTGLETVQQLIDSAAVAPPGASSLRIYGQAGAGALATGLWGALGSEATSRLVDNFTGGSTTLSTSDYVMAGVEILTSPIGGKVTGSIRVASGLKPAATEALAAAKALRKDYLGIVDELASMAQRLRASGSSAEEVVRTVAPIRNEVKLNIRDRGSWFAARLADARNLLKYGDRAGPSPDDLFEQYGSWEGALDAIQRTNPHVNTLTGAAP